MKPAKSWARHRRALPTCNFGPPQQNALPKQTKFYSGFRGDPAMIPIGTALPSRGRMVDDQVERTDVSVSFAELFFVARPD